MVVAEAAIDSISLPDTFGSCMPQAQYHLVKKMREWTGKPIEIHPHNTYSTGVASALAAVMAGAEVVHTTGNGLGDGGGNSPLEAIAMNLNLMLGIDPGIKLEKTYEVCKLVEELSQVPLQANWPLAGERVFSMESGIGVDFFKKMAVAGLSVPVDKDIATIVGRKRQIIVGKMSGRTSIEVRMEQLGLPKAGDEQLKEILDKVKTYSIQIRRGLNDDEFKKIVSDVTGS